VREHHLLGSTTFTYGHDADGNATTGTPAGTLGYDDAGQMTSAGNGPEAFAYAGDTQDQVLSDATATGITYGLSG
jgi:hypothetical protein